MQTIDELGTRWAALKQGLDSVILGQDAVKEQAMVCLLAGGHGLLECGPGTGKTLLVRALAKLLGCKFRRIQFTPELMPADLLGANIFNQKTQEFDFREGPIFTDLLLADEVNRTPPRTQAALLESMQESAATIDGERHVVSEVFTVFATQNPIEFEGTYPLPEAQRDRFLLKIEIDFPGRGDERAMIAAYASGRRLHAGVVESLTPVMTKEQLSESRALVRRLVRVEEGVQNYIVSIVRMTREREEVQIAAGPRASLALLEASRALAALRGRDFVTPDDVKATAQAVLIHRVSLNPEAEMEGLALQDLLKQIFDQVEVPR